MQQPIIRGSMGGTPFQPITPKKTLKFSRNWNGKLQCHFYTTIRLADDDLQVCDYVQVWLFPSDFPSVYEHKGCIIRRREIWLHELDDATAFQDMGVSAIEARELLKQFYPNTDFSAKKLAVLLIENIEFKQW